MNLINKILVLIIILFIINRLANNNLSEMLTNAIFNCKSKVENFMGLTYTNKKGVYTNTPIIPYQSQRDFSHINKDVDEKLDEESYNLYKFLDSLIRPNNNMYELTVSNVERYEASQDFIDKLKDNLSRILNCNDYKFMDIKILDDIILLKNPRGIEIEPFRINADISYKEKILGNVVLQIESFYRYDKIGYKNKDPGLLTFQSIKLVERKHIKEKIAPKIETAYTLDEKYNVEIKESFDDMFVNIDDIESENSIIPSTVKFSDYEHMDVKPPHLLYQEKTLFSSDNENTSETRTTIN
jgi:hypothetical protein